MGKILIVDDYEANRELLERRLKSQGHVTCSVDNGKKALEELATDNYDLVLLDIMMPLMSGFEVLEALNHQNLLNRLPVIVISGLDEIESVVKCIELGAVDYLFKPFNPVLLKARVTACLEKKNYLDQLAEEKRRADDLLHVILPPSIAEELIQNKTVLPKYYEKVVILFCDIVDFTTYCNQHTPQEVVSALQEVVELYENLAIEHHIQKIKTSGDAFLGAAGLTEPSQYPIKDCIECGLKMAELTPQLSAQWEVRIGIHAGPVMAGVVGHRQFFFDVWGDTVNIAARLAEHGSIGGVTLSQEALGQLGPHYETISLGKYSIKGKGNIELFKVNRLYSEIGGEGGFTNE